MILVRENAIISFIKYVSFYHVNVIVQDYTFSPVSMEIFYNQISCFYKAAKENTVYSSLIYIRCPQHMQILQEDPQNPHPR